MGEAFIADDVVDRGLALLEQSEGQHFLFLHFFDPHFPYHAPPPFLGKFGPVNEGMEKHKGFFPMLDWIRKTPDLDIGEVINRYDEEILYTDHALGRFFASLKEMGLYDKSWIIVLSDHGEEFLDHGHLGHSTTMYEEIVRVPLIVKAPNDACAGARFNAGQIPQAAIPSLILRFAVDPEATADAVSCHPGDGALKLLHDLATEEPIIADSRLFGPVRFMARTPEKKLLSPISINKGEEEYRQGFELYDLESDPEEKTNLFDGKGAAPELEGVISNAYKEASESPGAAGEKELDAETLRTLKSLGYLQ